MSVFLWALSLPASVGSVDVDSQAGHACRLRKFAARITDAFVVTGGVGVGVMTSNAVAKLSASQFDDARLERRHLLAARYGAQAGAFFLLCGAIPAAFLDEWMQLAYFFGLGAGFGQLPVAATQVAVSYRRLWILSPHYLYTALYNAISGAAALAVFATLAADAVSGEIDCNDLEP